jgi:prevent-host-death family protein
MAMAIRRSGVRRVPLFEIKYDLSRFLREAESEEIVIIRNGKPAGVLIGFGSEDDWLDYRLENAFCAASSRRERACGRDAAPGSRNSSEETRNTEASSRL